MGRLLTKDLLGPPISQSGEETKHRCPFCDDLTGHLYVNAVKGVYFCFKCGAKGKYVEIIREGHFLYEYGQLDNLEKKMAKTAKEAVKEKVVKTLPINEDIMLGREDRYGAWTYLANRMHGREYGPLGRIIDAYDLRVSRDEKSKGAVLFPIYSLEIRTNEDLKYYTMRNTRPKGWKYLNAPWPKDDTLMFSRPWNENFQKWNVANDGVAIVEGPFDVISMGRVMPTIGLLGKQATVAQLARIQKMFSHYAKFYICLDRDAFKNAIQLRLQLGSLFNPPLSSKNIKIIQFGDKDPGSSTMEEIRERIKNEDIQLYR